jgi:ABC-type bacteriocin/lantibiotic exporter with double-glycine peptidase domain
MYLGGARPFHPDEFRDDGWIVVSGVAPVLQTAESDCGAAALATVLAYWGDGTTRDDVMRACPVGPGGGLVARDVRDQARVRGFSAYLLHGQITDLVHELSRGRPVIVGLVKPYLTGDMCHYEVATAIHPERGQIVTIDPARGWCTNSLEGFLAEWEPADRLTIVVFRSAGGKGGD